MSTESQINCLLIEDDEDNIRMMEEIIDDMGFVCTCIISTLAEAEEVVGSSEELSKYQIIFSDENLSSGDMSGEDGKKISSLAKETKPDVLRVNIGLMSRNRKDFDLVISKSDFAIMTRSQLGEMGRKIRDRLTGTA